MSTIESAESAKPSKLPPFDPADPLGIDDLLDPEDLAIRDTVRGLGRRPGPAARRRVVREAASCPASVSWPASSARSARSACRSRGTAARAPPPSSTDSPAWSWRPPTPGSARSSPSRARSPCTPSTASAREEQKQRWLPGMAAGEIIGCFGLTEPDHGSDPAGMRTYAKRDGGGLGPQRPQDVDHQRLGGRGRRRLGTDRRRASAASSCRPTRPGFSAPEIKHKWSLRASVTSELVLDEVRLPADAVLPEVTGLRGPLSCLSHARYGIVWGAMGAARASFEAAVDYAKTREQFGRPIGGFQLTQAKLADMAVELHKGILLAHHLGRRMDAGTAPPRAGQLRQAQQRAGGDRDLPHLAHDSRRQRDLARIPGDAACDESGVGAHLRGHRRDAPAGAGQGAHRSRRVPVERDAGRTDPASALLSSG